MIYFFIFGLFGCTFLRYSEQLSTLKELEVSQKEIELYVEEQERFLYVLLDDIKNKRLKLSTSKENILKTYGEPVISKEVTDDPLIKEAFLYRHPTQYFTSDKVYLYFDELGKLLSWKYK
ncbi:MAG: hypothetical protein KKD55_03150 [Candidatus Omnitrophica bacterium]|nr:hypothetical protein [Candidatus Omnitrophota bacterium]MBU0897102.1 hypothetical protein [Candidatus Omnitrophota bacterium]MBU1367335.1 hypothetical protein [Candidatus Omnitrophota bacterium]MBU1524295.1 hypothetical protein [Candidatus Omnitrophota bacterium]MBU1811062.1 hypothetical protein [Candidatus Omnitrophota bacterium]